MRNQEQNTQNDSAIDKSKFVLDILDYAVNKKVDEPTKSRLLNIISKEVSKSDIEDKNILKRIENLEIKIKNLPTIIDPPPINKSIKRHSPKNMVKFLYHFSIDEQFKWFTHNPEGLLTEFDYKNYIENAKTHYKKATGWNINDSTYHNVKNFILDSGEKSKTKVYGKGQIDISWRDLERWCSEIPNTHPYNAQVNSQIFRKYINQFKQIIEFRTDDPDLTFNIRIRRFIRDLLGVDFKLVFSESFNEIGQSVRIFCDVNQLFYALEQILEWIVLKKALSNDVEINLLELEEYYIFEIFHKSSYLPRSYLHEKLKGLSGDFNKVRKMLFCVADWEMITTLEESGKTENYRIVLLNENTQLIDKVLTINEIEKSNANFVGIKHALKLFKTQNL